MHGVQASTVLAGTTSVGCAKAKLAGDGAIVKLHSSPGTTLLTVHVGASLLYLNISARTSWFSVTVPVNGEATSLSAQMFLTTEAIGVVKATTAAATPNVTKPSRVVTPAGGNGGQSVNKSNVSTHTGSAGTGEDDDEMELVIAVVVFLCITICSTVLFVL